MGMSFEPVFDGSVANAVMSMKYAKPIYVILLHLFLVLVLLGTDYVPKVFKTVRGGNSAAEISEFHRVMVQFHQRVDENLNAGCAIFIGDSHIQGLAVDAIAPKAVNYGIGGDTTAGVLERLPSYGKISQAKVVVLMVGYNDLRYRDDNSIGSNYSRILKAIPAHVPILTIEVPLVNEYSAGLRDVNKRIRNINKMIKVLVEKRDQSVFLPLPPDMFQDRQLKAKYHRGDGIHLNAGGYEILISMIKKAMAEMDL